MSLRVLILAALLLVPATAGAQGPASPFEGLFGRSSDSTATELTKLEFRSAVGGQYDDATTDDRVPLGLAATNGTTAGLTAGLDFERRRERLRFNLYGHATQQQYFGVAADAFDATSYNGGGQVVAKLATRFSFEGSALYRRSPFFHLVAGASGELPSPGVMVPADAFAARRLENDTLETEVGFRSPYTKRSTLSASVSRRATRFFNQPANDFELWGARGLWTRRLTRGVAARIGYGREEIQTTIVGAPYTHEIIDVGFDLAREITVARRTALNFTAQTSVLRHDGERRYRLNGSLGLNRRFRRTWVASVLASRNTEFLPGFLEPVFSHGVNGSVSGLVADRIEWSTAIGASRGQVGFDSPQDFINYTATSRLSAGLSRHLGLYTEYSYYQYDIPRGASAVVLRPQLSRQSISVGLSAFVPIFSRMRAPLDPR